MSGDKGGGGGGRAVGCKTEGRGRGTRAAASGRLGLDAEGARRAVVVGGAPRCSFGVSGPPRFSSTFQAGGGGRGEPRLGSSGLRGAGRGGFPCAEGSSEEFGGGPRGPTLLWCP